MNTPRRVLYVGNDCYYFLIHRLALARAARRVGYEVHVAMPYSTYAKNIVDEGFTYHAIVMRRGRPGVLSEMRSLRSLYGLYKGVRPDLVHHHTIRPVIYGGVSARMVKVPAVVSGINGLGYTFMRRGVVGSIIRRGMRAAYRIALKHPNLRALFHNADDRNMFVGTSVLDAARAIVIRGSGVDVRRLLPMKEPAGVPVITLIGRMLWDKGVREFVKAAELIAELGISARFALVGDVDEGNPSSISRHILQEWHNSGVVEWWGWRDAVDSVYRESHVVCLPSIREGLPRTLIEGAACGRPLVATDVPGCREVVCDGRNGFLIPLGDYVGLANALKKLIVNRELRLSMGRYGRELAEKYFADEVVIADTLRVYAELMA